LDNQETTQSTKASILSQVANELREQKKKQVKSDIKTLLEDREKAIQTLDSIDQKIVDKLTSVGESEDSIRALLK
jgi:hypothetical protein